MLIRKNKVVRNFISVFFAVMYLFVALFSSQLHSHAGESYFKDSGFKKTEKSISKEVSKSQSGDCLACHFLATGNSLVPEEFAFHFENHTNETKQTFSVQEKIWSQTKFTFQLRGPPSIS
ncbi:hypothetical protein [Epilithonimonas hungarica]|uniref:Uncharacterized protein n=1 Tax=Epilithonimonas hungarica TaxID=454006 RepID=A0A1G7VKF5_9FLAO|nr:hypothetical protein [Epilithonimonas hungarica]MDP9957842.1 hypothetical protein [Epilithonimonas hungarica]SDG60285.1 hypothetical protein SAMN05421825_3665 [Epilithonimonas hungarica]